MTASSLAAAVQTARYDQRLTQEDVEARGGPSVASLRTIENGRGSSFRSKTLRSLETALGWPTGTASALLRNEALPTPQIRDVDLAALITASVSAGRMRLLHGGTSAGTSHPT